MDNGRDRDQPPGTEYLVDVEHNLEVSHAGRGTSDVVLLPQPTTCGSDPLTWSVFKRYYQLFLLALYALSFSYGENTLGAAWTTVSDETGVTLENMNAGSALNYLLLGFGNVLWIPLAMKIGRRPVFLLTTAICLGSAVWTGMFHGVLQWFLSEILNGVGTSAYQAVIQLSVFDTFFVHERGKGLSFYLFGQQLGSILGLITGGTIADGPGWRWSQYIVAIIEGGVLVLMFFTFEETLFPRFLFPTVGVAPQTEATEAGLHGKGVDEFDKRFQTISTAVESVTTTQQRDFPERTYSQKLRLWTYFPEDRTTYWQYFRRPFFLFTFPTVVISGIMFAFGCTAGIVTFNTISEIMTEAPYNWSTTATGFIFFAALIGNFIGWATGAFADKVVVFLARRNNGVKEPEMRLWTLCICFLYAAVGYFIYGWGAQNELHWIAIAIGICAVIAHQVSVCSVATAYAMDSFPGISGELVCLLAICSSCINFAISYSVQPFINATGYGWAFTFYGLCVLSSMGGGGVMIVYGKSWRRKCAARYYAFLDERGATE